ncbi:hypothetical protein [Raineyella fluvialis]|uniref:ABC transporter n=1 Tax=Raineyella fluvialis TaxID=2662261 RepID=A0A5Q2F813_9ACTN|nr:hypothetical protein [Raineyella fluvialis]QGF22969.1 hypothetical protein Rai3103_04005 [Raineyella fluvialis]
MATALNGDLPGAATVRDIDLELTSGLVTVVTAAEERTRRNLLRLIASSCSLTSGHLVYRGPEGETDLAVACARDVVAVRRRRIVCSILLRAAHPALSCAHAVAEIAHCTVDAAAAELAALGHGHAVDLKAGDTRGSDRSVLAIAATLLHPAPIVLVDLTNHTTVEVRERVTARARRGGAVLAVTDALLDGLPAGARTRLLTAEGRLL